jgi:predicted nucleic acid-binding protein
MEILLDTSFLLAYHNKRDSHHERALQIDIENAGINDYIHSETLNIIHSRQGHRKAVEYGKFLRRAF